ncbi:hypothetical protein NQ317_016671 [Molorchus minor]|uniref:RNA-directed DNA polymerase n=1 Tax=Molorchus minor TaxID=1323400 RepID=A0ABQ9JPT3_9CUCU|nr:hypothetical protein NQ317_016671 [Molorchus minor]
MVIDTGSYHTIVKPNILAHCKMKPTTNHFILETAGGETLPVIGVHEAEFQLGRTVFRHQVFVANITDDVLMGLELMKKHGFQLNLQERSIKTGHDEIIISMPSSDEKFGSHCRRTAVVKDDNWETKKLAEEQQKDEDIKPFIAWKEEGTRPEWKDISNKSTTLKGYWAIWDSLIVEDGILKRLWENTDGKEIRKQIVLPRARVNEVLQEVHGGVGGGHFGVNKTLNKVRERFYWLRSRADVEDWCRRIDAIHDEARNKLQFESDRLKTRYDARSNNSGYQAGDEVWLYNPARKKGRSPKLQKSWEGPYTLSRGSTIWFIESNGTPSKNESCSSGPPTPLKRSARGSEK